MILMSYSDKSSLVASWGGYVASNQMMSRDKLKHQVSKQFLPCNQLILSRNKLILSHEMTYMRDGGDIIQLL